MSKYVKICHNIHRNRDVLFEASYMAEWRQLLAEKRQNELKAEIMFTEKMMNIITLNIYTYIHKQQ